MSTQSQHVNRTGWASGPWDDEPDNRTWDDGATGLPCIILRRDFGNLCGYVGIPAKHGLFALSYDDEGMPGLEVHGSLTYSESRPGKGAVGDGYWWLGFDCNHNFDHAPSPLRRYGSRNPDDYRNLPYVKAQCAQLAAQLARGISVSPHSHLDEGESNEP